MKRTGKRYTALLILICMCIANILSIFQQIYPGILYQDITGTITFPPSDIALISSYTLLTYGLSQIPVGILTDKFGAKKILIIFQLGIAACTFLLIFTNSSQVVLISRLLVGCFLAAVVPGMKVVASEFSENEFARASSILMASGALGSVLASTPLALLNSAIGWQASLGLLACISLACGVLLFFIPIKEEKVEAKDRISAFKTLKVVLTNKEFVLILIWCCSITGVACCLANLWIGRYVIDALHLTPVHAGHVMFTGGMSAAVGMTLWAFVCEKFIKSEKKCLVIGSTLYATCILLFSFFPITYFPAFLIFFGFINIMGPSLIPLCITAARRELPFDSFATANGCINSGGPLAAAPIQSVFNIILFSAASIVLTVDDFAKGFFFLGCVVVVGLIAVMFLKNNKASA